MESTSMNPQSPFGQQPPVKRHALKSILIGALLLLIGAALGATVTYFLTKDNQPVATTKETSSTTPAPTTIPTAPAEIMVANRGAFKLLLPTDTVEFHAIDYTTFTDDPAHYVTLKIPREWHIYRLSADKAAGDGGGIFVKTDTGKYIHIRNVSGVGGACEPNTTAYTLDKKLATGTSTLFFTQYSYSGQKAAPSLNLEIMPSPGKTEAHNTLKEGQTDTNTCNLYSYSFASSPIYVTISSSEVSALSSNLSWNDIKDDSKFVAALQSLTVVKK